MPKTTTSRTRYGRAAAAKARPHRWSQKVTHNSDALDLDHGVFANGDPKEIAHSLKRSAEQSKRRKGTAYQSAMSMLNFYINRAGSTLPRRQRHVLERAKNELRTVFGRD